MGSRVLRPRLLAVFLAVFLAVLGLLLSTREAAVSAADAPRIGLGRCALEIAGDSTLHKYSAISHACHASFVIDPRAEPSAPLGELIRLGRVQAFSLEVGVTTFQSGDASLDRHLWKALKNPQAPRIQFDMDSYRVLPAGAPGEAFRLALHGRVRVAGATRPVDLTAVATPIARGFRVTGAKDLRMTDFGVTPPTLLFGRIKAADGVTVKFDVELTPAPP